MLKNIIFTIIALTATNSNSQEIITQWKKIDDQYLYDFIHNDYVIKSITSTRVLSLSAATDTQTLYYLQKGKHLVVCSEDFQFDMEKKQLLNARNNCFELVSIN